MSIIRHSAASATPDTVRHALHTAGFCVINYGDVGSVAQAQALTLDLARDIGTPMAHDKRGALLWDIRAQSGGTTEGRTFSEHNDEAVLHTDSQYRDTPEDAFCLYCIKPAACGGGAVLCPHAGRFTAGSGAGGRWRRYDCGPAKP